MENKKRLSIITINYNNRDGLKKTIESVINQTFQDYEYIIIDGGSTDGSIDVIKEFLDRITYWISEKDSGIYNAMNKGVLVAHGEYVQFLNSGDVLYDKDVLVHVFENQIEEDIVCGNLISDNGRVWIVPEDVTMEYFFNGTLPHPSSFIRRTLFEKHKYDERFKIAGDWEFFVYHLIVGNVKYKKININVAIFDTTGISSITQREEHDPELRNIVLSTFLYPRVRCDYRLFMGELDSYHRLFYIISRSKHRRLVYSLVVLVLKIIMCNKKWINSFSLIEK